MRTRMICVELLCIILCPILIVDGAKFGPYQSKWTKVAPCPNPKKPIDENPPSYLYAELYNSSSGIELMRGNITVAREHKLKQMKAKSYLLDANNKWRVIYIMNNMGCNRFFFPVLTMATGVKYDIKNCIFYKGIYLFEHFELNKIQHMWMKTLEYGQVKWRIEVFSEVGTTFCYEFGTLIEPLNK